MDRPTAPDLTWHEDGTVHRAALLVTAAVDLPRRVVPVTDGLSADRALRLAQAGTAMLWRGDFVGARQVLDAMKRRIDRATPLTVELPAAFVEHRRRRAERARLLGRLLVELTDTYAVRARRAPDVAAACHAVHGPATGPALVSVQELLGLLGAQEWRRRGVEVPALHARIHPHHGVFAPTRGDYVDLVAGTPLPAGSTAPTGTAFDVGTGTGVLAALLARRGVPRVVATDVEPRAVACARENVARLGLAGPVDVVEADLFPHGRAQLVVCNPPWLPGVPTSPIEGGVYDPDGEMLARFLHGLPAHLADGGEAWLVLSDLAELLGLRAASTVPDLAGAAGLAVVERRAGPPRTVRRTPADVVAAARARETVWLWRLRCSGSGG